MDGDSSFDAFGSVKKFHGKVRSMKIQFLRGVFIWRVYLLFFEGRRGKIVKYLKYYLHWLYLNIFVNSACPFIIIKHQSCVRGEITIAPHRNRVCKKQSIGIISSSNSNDISNINCTRKTGFEATDKSFIETVT